ncbi:VOC family protein [Niabella sp. CJ426]|uniref:VOC family protein n=1 Tax=Niabella sp. CJ426 TaxID=3393740 RepID=UPI003D0064DC
MKLTALRPMIYTDQLEDTIRFYTDMLGFILAGKNEDWGWASLYKDQVSIMLAKPNQHEEFEKPVFTGSFYFNTDEVDALWQSLKDKVKVCYPIENFEWEMREFAIYDNNGYLLQFGQDIAALK